MSEPILIIHGVANHEPGPFYESVNELQQQLGPEWELLPVFWGDLGGGSRDIADCLPVLRHGDWGVRSDDSGQSLVVATEVVEVIAGLSELSNADRAQLIAAPAAAPDEFDTRAGAPDSAAEEIDNAARIELPDTQVLQFIDNPAVLQSLGETIRVAMQAMPVDGSSDMRQYETRGLDVPSVARRLIRSVDDLLGKFVGNQLGMANQHARAEIAGPFAGFCGDIIVYQRNQAKIQARIWEALSSYNNRPEHASQLAYGTPERPVHAIGHSLGGVILFDTAVVSTNGQSLWLNSLTTFGSQAAFFHIIDQRPGLAGYAKDSPVKLPPTIRRWVNLWDTLDLLAFTAGTVFRLSNGESPHDIPVREALSELWHYRLWLHSVYWKSTELRDALRIALAP